MPLRVGAFIPLLTAAWRWLAVRPWRGVSVWQTPFRSCSSRTTTKRGISQANQTKCDHGTNQRLAALDWALSVVLILIVIVVAAVADIQGQLKHLVMKTQEKLELERQRTK